MSRRAREQQQQVVQPDREGDAGEDTGEPALDGRCPLAGPVRGRPDSGDVQALAERQVAWLRTTTEVTPELLVGLGQMYVDDPRFREQYDGHGRGTAVLVRDALQVWADRHR